MATLIPLKKLPELSDMMKDTTWASEVNSNAILKRSFSVPTGRNGGEPRKKKMPDSELRPSKVQVMTWTYSEGLKGYRFYAAEAKVWRHVPTNTYWTDNDGFDAVLAP